MGWALLRELPSSAFTRSSGIPFHCFTQTPRIVTHKSGYALNREGVGNSACGSHPHNHHKQLLKTGGLFTYLSIGNSAKFSNREQSRVSEIVRTNEAGFSPSSRRSLPSPAGRHLMGDKWVSQFYDWGLWGGAAPLEVTLLNEKARSSRWLSFFTSTRPSTGLLKMDAETGVHLQRTWQGSG